jgi:hypothetical protein
MKKILITGFNAEQVQRDYFLKKQLKILNSHYSLIRCLEDMGYIVEQRPVEHGEDISHYDDVIVYLHSIQSFCQRLFTGLYAVAARPDCILAFDDWQVDQVFNSFSAYEYDLINQPEKAFRQYLFDLYAGKESQEFIKSQKQTYIDAVKIVNSKENRLLICAFYGGDVNKFGLDWKGSTYTYNPNPYNLNRRPENNYGETNKLTSFFGSNKTLFENKEKAWVFSSLIQMKTQKWLKLQNPSWEVKQYGAKRGVYKSERVTEPEMCKIYDKNWGCLMPTYYHEGSGWWRSRVQQVADVESILLCSDKEGSIYGEAFVGNTIEKIENSSFEELKTLAIRQKECLYDNHPLDKEKQKQEILKVLHETR